MERLDKITFKLLKKFYKAGRLTSDDISKITGYSGKQSANPYINILRNTGAIRGEQAPIHEVGYGLPPAMGLTGDYNITVEGKALYESIAEDNKRYRTTRRISIAAIIISFIALLVAIAALDFIHIEELFSQ